MLSQRLVFALLLTVNAVLFAKSRYGEIPSRQVSWLHGEQSLVRRISSELMSAQTESEPVNECRPLSFPLPQQCTHVVEDCPVPETFLSIHYVKQYFCTQPSLRPVMFVGLIIWLIFLFSTLGISASDFFTPNLATIATLLGLDENVAGVTFLAFGNGSPDVFSTFSAMRANSGSLAIGELLGAASFIVSCVVGSMCIIRPFEVNRGPFLRDVGFFTVAVSLLLVILSDGHIRPWEAALMIVLYIFYVAWVVVGTCTLKNLERAQYADTERYQDDPSPVTLPAPSPPRSRAISNPEPLRIETTRLPRRPHSRTPSPSSSYSHMPSFSLVGALEFRHVVASLRQDAPDATMNMFDSIPSLHSQSPYAGGHYHSHSRSRPRTPSREIDPWDTALSVPLNDRSPPQLTLTPAQDEPETMHMYESGHLDEMSQSSISIPRTLSDGGDTDSTFVPPATSKLIYVLREVYHTIFPSMHHFHNQSVLGKVASLFAVPAVMLLTITLPVVVTPYDHDHSAHEKMGDSHNLIGFEEEGEERALIAEDIMQEQMHGLTFSKWLTAVQCVLGPLFCIGVLFRGTAQHIWLLLAAFIAGTAMAVLVIVFADKAPRDHSSFRMARCCMVWIMAIADEVVNVLQTFGFIFGLSDAIIGLTIFAVGNSLADLVANMSVAVFAPIMGFSACFGGPMLNILLGIGISGSYIISQTGMPYDLHFGATLFVSTIGLLALLVTTLVVVPWNNYHLSRSWGVFLICSYITIMAINVVVELKG
ncbi:hypothetical protein BDZ89DRAFT_1058430 [Hymenopellis radicata]|nr:hypothetical protein BDZ89DRAFT_1058430 [Hymenopellis radicata]